MQKICKLWLKCFYWFLANYIVKVNGESIPCTPKEVEILFLLASHSGQVMGRDQILSLVWGYDYTGDPRTVDTHIKRIRQKVFLEGARTPVVKYSVIELAENEAKRLAKMYNKKAYVLCSIKSFEVNEFTVKDCRPDTDSLPF